MHRLTPRDAGFRSYHGMNRGAVNKVSDDSLMQSLDADMMANDSRDKIERAQNYGFTSVVLPAKKEDKETAEAFIVHQGGNRSHPVAVAIDDRRHRPYGLKEGESQQYDDQGQASYIARDGVYVLSNKDMASLRHVNKDKQPRKKQKGQADYNHKGTVNAEVRCTKTQVLILLGTEVLAEIVDGKVYLGGKSSDPMAKVLVEGGVSKNVYARLP